MGGTVSGNYFDGQADAVVQAGNIYGDVVFNGPRRPEAPVLQVPAPPEHYRNNEAQLKLLTEIHHEATGRIAIALVLGAPGSGRTTLCETWLHGQLDRFDRFFSVRVGHRAGADVLAELLSLLGYGPDEMPASLEARSAMWRAQTAGFQVALLIDDVVSAADVKALLPTCPGSCVLVVGSGLEALRTRYSAREVELEPLGREAALGVLTDLVGEEKLAAEPAHRDELIRICAGSAAELNVAGTLLAARGRTVERLVARIRAKGALASAVFDVAYEWLNEHEQAAYRFFGAHPGSGDVQPDTIAAVLSLDEYEAEDAVQKLVSAKLVEELGGRYRISVLAGLHAATLAGELPEAVVGYYAEHGLRIAECASPTGWPRKIWPDFTAASLSADEAWSWLFAEQANLLAAAEAALLAGAHEDVIRLARALWPVYRGGAYSIELVSVSQDAVLAAQAAAMPLAEGLVRTQLGFAQMQRRDWAGAQEQFAAVAELAATPEERASALEARGLACFEPGLIASRNGRQDESAKLFEQAEALFRSSLALAEEIGDPRRLALIRMHLAKVVSPEEAGELLAESWQTVRTEPDNAVKVRLWQGRKLIEAGCYVEGANDLAELDPAAEKAKLHRERILGLRARAEAALARGYPEQAKAHAKDALNIAQLHGYSAEVVDLRLWTDRL
ncbi:NB-ARC domain-containing protein [Amycolatopsis jiangsuensis]|uniref:Tetratricopeptide (TPR) repeat protein n=1 Tax=Amycolatopsis jiangsuensis TaxID=1181879 RepID=A0A840IX41_9PSEU|nr:NB-ARC domain-containing protein [Amycolatopsis jiangsuensis]MBB4687176.1 tetratricopeptide (TPR) repeat protein [Amycolatopsis jiangsuensis]